MSKLWVLALVVACTPSPPAPPPAAPRPPAPAADPGPAPSNPKASGPFCGGRGAPPCDPSMFCNFPLSARCGIADAPGRCTKRPEMCAQIYQPVCGCDGKTYGNACTANAAGVGVLSKGECPERAP